MDNTVHISPKHQEILLKIIANHLPNIQIWVYGSRINGRSHNGSDLDIVLITPDRSPIPPNIMASLTEDIENSLIPFLVDVRDWNGLPDSFHQEINRHHVKWEI